MKRAAHYKLLAIVIILISSCNTGNRRSETGYGWNTYRHNNSRTAVTPETLPAALALKWVHKSPHAPSPVWDLPAEEMKRTHSDDTYQVTAANGIAYYGSSVDNKVYALDIPTGKIKWVFYTEGPVRFSPTIWNKRIYFGSDDGYVYCLNAVNGKQIWKYRPGPKDSRIIGNGRLVSLWPVRTSVLVQDNTVYFGAGVFPYDGLYVCALNATDGSVIWKNDDLDDDVYELRYGGISPQSYLLANETKLFVPSGRALPAVFDRQTGKFLYYLAPVGKQGGTWAMIDQGELVAGTDRHGYPARVAYDTETGEVVGDVYASFNGIDMTGTDNMSYIVTRSGIFAIDRIRYPVIQQKIDSMQRIESAFASTFIPGHFNALWPYVFRDQEVKDRLEEIEKLSAMVSEKENLKASLSKWFYPQTNLNSIILTGNQVITGGQDIVAGLDIESGAELWNGKVEGMANGLTVSGNHLIVSTDKGYIYCFSALGDDAEGVSEIKKHEYLPSGSSYTKRKNKDYIASAADHLVIESGITRGYCLVLDCGEGELIYELAKRSELTIIGIDRDIKKVRKAKRFLDEAGLYGKRVIAEHWPASSLPEYFADLVVSAAISGGQTSYTSDEIFRVMRPGGGMAYFYNPVAGNTSAGRRNSDKIKYNWKSFEVRSHNEQVENGGWIAFKRLPLTGAGGWTHQFADPGNTSCSDDELVKAPFSTIWYGSPAPVQVPERHARSAAPLAYDGKLFVQGQDGILAYNAYNGTFLWESKFVGSPRARIEAEGGNLAVNQYGVFLVAGDSCVQMDMDTGETISVYKLPAQWKDKPGRWGFLAVKDNILLGSAARLYTQIYDYYTRTVFDDSENMADSETLGPVDGLLADFYKYRESGNFDEVQKAFQRDGTKWKHMAEFPHGDPGTYGLTGPSHKILTSNGLFAFDLETKELLWTTEGERIPQVSISVGEDAVYFSDITANTMHRRAALSEKEKYIRQGKWEKFEIDLDFQEADVRLVSSLDIITGRINWKRAVDLSGCGDDFTASGYRNGVLLFFGSYGLHDKWRFLSGQLKWHRITALSAKNGEMMWSRPLNYMVRPLIIGDEIIIEPRKCDLFTGDIITRINPVTGQEVPWEFYRPGHACGPSSANTHCLFYRSSNSAYYDLKEDKGLTYYGAIRPGCLINMIPGNGLVLFPDASSGCTCSYPIRTSVALKPADPEEVEEWSLYVNNAPLTPVKHLAINLGAPGDMKDRNGTIWYGYPRQYALSRGYPRSELYSTGLSLSLNEVIRDGMGFYSYDSKGVEMKGTDSPWLYTNGCVGLEKCEIPLIGDIFGENPGIYTVRLGFAAPSTRRKFDIKIQGETVMKNIDVLKETGSVNHSLTKEFYGIIVSGNLLLELVPEKADPGVNEVPVINFIEIIREDQAADSDYGIETESITSGEALRLLTHSENNRLKDNLAEALAGYHRVFLSSDVKEYRLKALSWMKVIASPESLPVIKKYCQNLDPIMWDYKEPDEEIVNAAMNVYTAIAKNIAKQNKELGDKMLSYSAKGLLTLR